MISMQYIYANVLKSVTCCCRYSHSAEVQVRLQFLTCVFSTLGSPDHFSKSLLLFSVQTILKLACVIVLKVSWPPYKKVLDFIFPIWYNVNLFSEMFIFNVCKISVILINRTIKLIPELLKYNLYDIMTLVHKCMFMFLFLVIFHRLWNFKTEMCVH